MKRFLKENSIELIAGFLVLAGVFLMVEPFEIREALLSAITKIVNAILSTINQVLIGAGNRAASLTTSDLIGIMLVLLAGGVIVWRIRHRFITGKRWAIDICPKCTKPIMRVHRNWRDRFLSATFLPGARRYRCTDPTCGWSGLLHRHLHLRRRRPEQASEIKTP
jgi:hypothetical protein